MRLRSGTRCHSATSSAGAYASSATAAKAKNPTAQTDRTAARRTNAVARRRKEALLRYALAKLLAGNSELGADDICKRYRYYVNIHFDSRILIKHYKKYIFKNIFLFYLVANKKYTTIQMFYSAILIA